MRRLFIMRKDLNMSAGKLSAQVGHCVEAYWMSIIKENAEKEPANDVYNIKNIQIQKDIFEEYIMGPFVKTVCAAKNKNQLMKAVETAEALGLIEGKDYFLIKDNCLTELEPEEIDENGIGRTLTGIGFKPLPDDIAHQISKKYQLYK